MKSWTSQKWNLTQNPFVMNMIFVDYQVALCARWEKWTWSNWDRLVHVSERWNRKQHDVWPRPYYDPILISMNEKRYSVCSLKILCTVFQLIISKRTCVKSQSKTHGSPQCLSWTEKWSSISTTSSWLTSVMVHLVDSDCNMKVQSPWEASQWVSIPTEKQSHCVNDMIINHKLTFLSVFNVENLASNVWFLLVRKCIGRWDLPLCWARFQSPSFVWRTYFLSFPPPRDQKKANVMEFFSF